jgi:hypothetical protein
MRWTCRYEQSTRAINTNNDGYICCNRKETPSRLSPINAGFPPHTSHRIPSTIGINLSFSLWTFVFNLALSTNFFFETNKHYLEVNISTNISHQNRSRVPVKTFSRSKHNLYEAEG